MSSLNRDPVEVLIVAVPETAGSALYGMVDVLTAAGNIWQTLVNTDCPMRPWCAELPMQILWCAAARNGSLIIFEIPTPSNGSWNYALFPSAH